MRKVEIFLPLPGMAKAMDEYFTKPQVFYLDGLPTGKELPAADLTEAELLAIGLEAAQEKVARLTLGAPEDYGVDPEFPHIAEFTDEAGKHIGWEFEFQVYAFQDFTDFEFADYPGVG